VTVRGPYEPTKSVPDFYVNGLLGRWAFCKKSLSPKTLMKAEPPQRSMKKGSLRRISEYGNPA
jgi:hypothetical protein